MLGACYSCARLEIFSIGGLLCWVWFGLRLRCGAYTIDAEFEKSLVEGKLIFL